MAEAKRSSGILFLVGGLLLFAVGICGMVGRAANQVSDLEAEVGLLKAEIIGLKEQCEKQRLDIQRLELNGKPRGNSEMAPVKPPGKEE